MGMGIAVLATGDFRRAHPAQHAAKLFAIFQALEGRIHHGQGVAKLRNRTVTDGQGQEQPACIRIFRNDLWQGLIETGLPHQGTPPLTDRTVPDPTEPRIT
ncbi:Uncharacterised protein [Salmonella enterica subsp. enterica serovar Typhimurium str. DT104]|nr:Uncharacterised protein [Salmonella enterica subsp. enterica serovar Typhimurium str. DT104]VFR99334.1 Uncharacterised protein [Salmonella enterica subsp. enterica serovar Typhimurium]CQB01739.1 Uncharacterised protein [Salmonella enterica subsp. enterica serovar Typhimurium str. DT104]CQC32521.1 Uncharacterised protein [Salmonella enterica subsp. enterica serovar Typhimurium str. DT104]CQF12670.1 Uncharacterised protein [Salmonella enterica subsp. enterica serovar Typhimurium str. DT104]